MAISIMLRCNLVSASHAAVVPLSMVARKLSSGKESLKMPLSTFAIALIQSIRRVTDGCIGTKSPSFIIIGTKLASKGKL